MRKYTTVDEFLNDLDTEQRAQVDRLRSIVAGSAGGLSEHVKWNAPSYVLDGVDRITFSVMNKDRQVKLVLHMGATRPESREDPPVMDDPFGLVAWQSDTRGILSFASLDQINSNEAEIALLVSRWLAIT